MRRYWQLINIANSVGRTKVGRFSEILKIRSITFYLDLFLCLFIQLATKSLINFTAWMPLYTAPEGISFQKRSQTITRIQYYYYYYYYTNIIIIKLQPSNVIHKDAKQGPKLLLMVVEFLRTLFGRSLLLRRRHLIGITIA